MLLPVLIKCLQSNKVRIAIGLASPTNDNREIQSGTKIFFLKLVWLPTYDNREIQSGSKIFF